MRFTLDRKMRPGEKIRISVDFSNDLPAGDAIATSACSAATSDEPNVDLTAANLEAAGFVGNVLGVTVKFPPVNKNLIVLYQVTTAAGYVFQHDVEIPVALAA